MASLSDEFFAKLSLFSDQLEQLGDQKAKQTALAAFLRELQGEGSHSPTTMLLPGGGTVEPPDVLGYSHGSESSTLLALLEKHDLHLHDLVMASAATGAEKPLERLPCANVEPAKNWRCQSGGRLACGECKLVSYCSKECQRTHWRTHKQDCKDPIRSPLWQPAWVREMREATFVTNSSGWTIPSKERQFALGLHIWGNIPAVDTLNLPKNEGASAAKSKISLAYVASGDLRNVVRTVNELPSDYSGELTILLNDREPTIALRNMMILMLLGTIEDVQLAVDIALHFWGSAFIPAPHAAIHADILTQLAVKWRQNDSFSVKLGDNSVITGTLSESVMALMIGLIHSELSLGDANTEMERIRFEPTRQDRHHRYYARLNPSHRLASLEFRRFGIILPFGAANNNFNTANKFLFSPEGRWLQDDLATPLESWNIEDVIQAGQTHGVQSADLYGCLYFYLTEQLRSFAERIRKFKISFMMFDQDARELAVTLRKSNEAYEAQANPDDILFFDRIDVSNIIDPEYVGISNVLADWIPFLSKTNPCATIVGYSMNWVPRQPNSQPNSSTMIGKLTMQLIAMGKISRGMDPALFPTIWKYLVALHDNSGPFEQYLKKQGIDDATRKTGSKLKLKHTIVPHRIGAQIDAPSKALPQFLTEDSWYWNVQVSSALLSERFVEFSRI